MKIKQILMGTLFLMGTLSYAQQNQVVEEIGASEKASSRLNIEVVGKVADPAKKSMVIEIRSSASPDGTGFAFNMPTLYKGQGKATLPGDFTVRIIETNAVAEMKGTLTVNLLKGDTKGKETKTYGAAQGLAGSASDTNLDYKITGAINTGKTQYDGQVLVTATPGSSVGSYSDTSVALQVEYDESGVE